MPEVKPPTGTPTTFGALALDACFYDHIGYGAGANAQKPMWQIWRKIDRVKAECIAQHGYGNRRGVGYWRSFGQQARVFQIDAA